MELPCLLSVAANCDSSRTQDAFSDVSLSSLASPHQQCHEQHHSTDRVERVLLHDLKEALSVRSHQHADHQGNAHDCGSDACGAHVVDRLEVLSEGKLPVFWLQRVSTPLVAWRGDDASSPDGDAKDDRLVHEAFWGHLSGQKAAN